MNCHKCEYNISEACIENQETEVIFGLLHSKHKCEKYKINNNKYFEYFILTAKDNNKKSNYLVCEVDNEENTRMFYDMDSIDEIPEDKRTMIPQI